MNRANIFNIQRFSIHDGPGIRTVVFFKGCPLRCAWCANPESYQRRPEIIVNKQNCIGCGACLSACAKEAVSLTDNVVGIDRGRCDACGSCTKECYTRALKNMGNSMTAEEVFQEIQKDGLFYKNSGGGFTLSGGEPLLYGEFCVELINLCNKHDLHGAIETSGYGNPDVLLEFARKLDLIFFDLKHMDDEMHKKYTGVSNVSILNNLNLIQGCAKEIIIRTPLVPGCNDSVENINQTADFISTLRNITTWELLPYHRLGEHKFEQLGQRYTLDGTAPPDKKNLTEFVGLAEKKLKKHGIACKINTSSI